MYRFFLDKTHISIDIQAPTGYLLSKTRVIGCNSPAQNAFLRTKFRPYLYNLASVGGIRYQITPVVNLFQRIFRRAVSVHFELEDKDRIRSFYNGVGAAFGAFHFRLDKLPHQREQQIENQLVMPFRPVAQIVGNGGEHGLHPAHKTVNIACPQIFYKIARIKFI